MVFTVKDINFQAGTELKISGKVKSNCEGFSINIGHDPDALALHFNPRFTQCGDTNVIVCNANQGGWLTITFNNETFYMKLPDGNMMSFPNRFGDDSFSHIDVRGDVKVISIKVK